MDDILREMFRLLDLHFPDRSSDRGPDWEQIEYRRELFRLCTKCFTDPDCCADDIAQEVRKQWKISRELRLTDEENDEIERLLTAWRHWDFALQHRHYLDGE